MPDPLDDTPAINEAARKALSKAAVACRRIGWFSFWTQLSLSIVSAGILLFSVAFTSQVRHSAGCPDLHTGLLLSGRLGGALAKGAGIWGTWVSIWSAMQNGPAVSLYLTLFGIVASFVSTFWSFGYTRLSRPAARVPAGGAAAGAQERCHLHAAEWMLDQHPRHGCNTAGLAGAPLHSDALACFLALGARLAGHMKQSFSSCDAACGLSGSRQRWDSWWLRRSQTRLPTPSWQAALGHTTQCLRLTSSLSRWGAGGAFISSRVPH